MVVQKLLILSIYIYTILSSLFDASTTSYADEVIITEIMYNPSVTGCEYIELYNKGDNVNLKNWRLGDYIKKNGVVFSEEDFFLDTKNYAVICEDSTFFNIFSTLSDRVIKI